MLETTEQNITTSAALKKVKVWDVPTRLFHWLLVILIVSAYMANKFSASLGGFYWHKINGYLILSLILFRIVWGFNGSTTSLFKNFIHPLKAIKYAKLLLKGRSPEYLGHNPLGAFMIIALLLTVLCQIFTGMYAANLDSFVEGPFASFISENTATLALKGHQLVANILIAFILIHITANVLYEAIKRNGLIGAMITGRKKRADFVDFKSNTAEPTRKAAFIYFFVLALVLAVVFFLGVGAFQG